MTDGQMRDSTYDFTKLGRVLGGIRGNIFRDVVLSWPDMPQTPLAKRDFSMCFDIIDGNRVVSMNKFLIDLTVKYMHCAKGVEYSEIIIRKRRNICEN